MQLFVIRLSKVYKERQNWHSFELKWLTYVKDKSFSLFALCASDNLFSILQFETSYSHYTLRHKN